MKASWSFFWPRPLRPLAFLPVHRNDRDCYVPHKHPENRWIFIILRPHQGGVANHLFKGTFIANPEPYTHKISLPADLSRFFVDFMALNDPRTESNPFSTSHGFVETFFNLDLSTPFSTCPDPRHNFYTHCMGSDVGLKNQRRGKAWWKVGPRSPSKIGGCFRSILGGFQPSHLFFHVPTNPDPSLE